MKRKFGKYLLALGIMLMVVMVALPSVAAYEGHMVDIRAHETIPATKMARLATPTEICYAEKHLGVDIPVNPNPPGIPAWNNVPVSTCVVWIVTIFVQNPLSATMNNVIINDQFNDDVEIALMGVSQGTVNIDQGNWLHSWHVGNLAPGYSACLTLIVWTTCTSTDGCYDGCDWNNNDCDWGWDWHQYWDKSDWCGYWNDYKWTCEQWGGWHCEAAVPFASNIVGTVAGCYPDCGGCKQEFTCTGLYYLNKSGIVMNWSPTGLNTGSYKGGPPLWITVYQPAH